jgi:hypothetical protein
VSADDRIDPEEHVADSRAHQTLKVELAKPAEETSLLLFFFSSLSPDDGDVIALLVQTFAFLSICNSAQLAQPQRKKKKSSLTFVLVGKILLTQVFIIFF